MWLGHVQRHESLLGDIIKERMKVKATRGWRIMHTLHLPSDLMKNRSYYKARSSRQNRLHSWNVTNLLVAAED